MFRDLVVHERRVGSLRLKHWSDRTGGALFCLFLPGDMGHYGVEKRKARTQPGGSVDYSSRKLARYSAGKQDLSSSNAASAAVCGIGCNTPEFP